MSLTCKIDKSTWGPVEDYIQNVLRVDLKKEPAFYTEWDPAIIPKNDRRPCKSREMAKGEGSETNCRHTVDN